MKMEVLRLSTEVDSNGMLSLSLDMGIRYKNKTIELILFDNDIENSKTKRKPDIKKYFGKLEWEGDGLEQQLKLRNEWK